jgi:acetyl-CoA carboxylase beta subunit
MIVPRGEMRDRLASILSILTDQPAPVAQLELDETEAGTA